MRISEEMPDNCGGSLVWTVYTFNSLPFESLLGVTLETLLNNKMTGFVSAAILIKTLKLF